MSEYDVRAAIRAVVETSDLTDPGEIARKVAENVPRGQMRAVLALALRDMVRIELHSYPSWRRPESAAQPGPAQAKAPARSAKVAGIQAWARLLRKPVAVEGNEWKQFGDCDSEDLAFLAVDRRRNAAESVAAAERFEKYAAALDEHGAARVADLPDSVIESIEDGT